MGFLAGLGMQAASQALSGGMGMLLGGINDRRQIKQQQKLTDMQLAANMKMTDYQHMKQLEMMNATSYGWQKEKMKEAGLNPALMYGMGGGGGATTGGGAANVNAPSAPSGGREVQDMLGMGMQLQLLKAQKENIEADTQAKLATAEKTAGVDTANVHADTELKKLNSIIAEYTGKEVKDVYEKIKVPNRGVEAKTYENELEARQANAETLYEMWQEGKLKELSMAQVEQVMIANAKTREEIKQVGKTIDLLEAQSKGQSLENMFKELDLKLQKETGLGRDSNGYAKIFARMLKLLMGQ